MKPHRSLQVMYAIRRIALKAVHGDISHESAVHEILEQASSAIDILEQPHEPRRNPSLVVYNPPDSKDGALMSERVYQVHYRHAENDKGYYHDFDEGVAMIALDDGDILLTSDKRLWEDFDL